LPLGKLAESTIQDGQRVLRKLADVINGTAEGSVNALSDEFYSVIPHDFGFQKMSSFVLRTNEDVKRKLEMLQSLSEVTFAIRLLSDVRADAAVDRITASYEKLACELEHLAPSDDVVALISRYVGTTAGNTAGHTHYTLEVEDVFAVRRSGEEERFRNGHGGRLGNHMLLWHGSRLSNWVRPPLTHRPTSLHLSHPLAPPLSILCTIGGPAVQVGILSKGLLIAPPEAPVTGYMFGKGLYFADIVTKRCRWLDASHLPYLPS
jgi:poly [ADP-ribose] polymerase